MYPVVESFLTVNSFYRSQSSRSRAREFQNGHRETLATPAPLFCVSLCVCISCTDHGEDYLSPSTLWVLGLELNMLGLLASVFTY